MERKLRELEQRMEAEGPTTVQLREFWELVNRAKLEQQLSKDSLNRIVRLRDTLFNKFYPPLFSLRKGLGLTAVAMLVGAVLIWYALQSDQLLFFLIGSAFLMVGTHPWGHWMAGKWVGVNYEYFYLDGPTRFEPCLKIDYRTYLKGSFDSRVLVHASGASATIVTALAILIAAFAAESLTVKGIAVLIFVMVIITEILAWAGLAAGDLRRARKELILKKQKGFL